MYQGAEPRHGPPPRGAQRLGLHDGEEPLDGKDHLILEFFHARQGLLLALLLYLLRGDPQQDGGGCGPPPRVLLLDVRVALRYRGPRLRKRPGQRGGPCGPAPGPRRVRQRELEFFPPPLLQPAQHLLVSAGLSPRDHTDEALDTAGDHLFVRVRGLEAVPELRRDRPALHGLEPRVAVGPAEGARGRVVNRGAASGAAEHGPARHEDGPAGGVPEGGLAIGVRLGTNLPRAVQGAPNASSGHSVPDGVDCRDRKVHEGAARGALSSR